MLGVITIMIALAFTPGTDHGFLEEDPGSFLLLVFVTRNLRSNARVGGCLSVCLLFQGWSKIVFLF